MWVDGYGRGRRVVGVMSCVCVGSLRSCVGLGCLGEVVGHVAPELVGSYSGEGDPAFCERVEDRGGGVCSEAHTEEVGGFCIDFVADDCVDLVDVGFEVREVCCWWWCWVEGDGPCGCIGVLGVYCDWCVGDVEVSREDAKAVSIKNARVAGVCDLADGGNGGSEVCIGEVVGREGCGV